MFSPQSPQTKQSNNYVKIDGRFNYDATTDLTKSKLVKYKNKLCKVAFCN